MNIQNKSLYTGWLFLILFMTACASTVSPTTASPPARISCANVWTPYYSSGRNYLGVVNGEPCLNAFRLIITFTEPVQFIALSFSGTSQSYVLQVYDENQILIGSKTQPAEFNNGDGTLFEVSFSSESNDIRSVQFGGPLGGTRVIIAVREIAFSKGGLDFKYNFDKFPDGTVITGDSQDAKGRMWHSLIGDEFTDWGFLVSTDLDEG